MNELFSDLPEVLSPRLRWMKEHGIRVEIDQSETIANGETVYSAYSNPMTYWKTGFTEDEAIFALAKANGWRMWNEEDRKLSPAYPAAREPHDPACPGCPDCRGINQDIPPE